MNAIAKIQKLRQRIDLQDRRLLQALAARFEIVGTLGELKRSLGLPALQPGRWKQVLRDRVDQGRALGLSAQLVTGLMKLIHKESLNAQRVKPKKSSRRIR